MLRIRMSCGLMNAAGEVMDRFCKQRMKRPLWGGFKRFLVIASAVFSLHAGGQLWAGASILLSPPGPSINAAAGQIIDVALVNNDAIQYDLSGITFVVKVGDGDTVGPIIESIDLIGAGLFFAGNGQSSVAGGNDRTKAETGFSFGDVTLSASQTATLARITLDASGTLGNYDISFDQPNILNQSTIVQGSNPPGLTLQDGVVTVVPEPATFYALFSFLAFGSIYWKRRKSRS